MLVDYIQIITSGELNKYNYLPYLKSIFDKLDQEQRYDILKAVIYLRSPRIGLGKEELGIYALKALIELDQNLVTNYLDLYISYCSWKDLNKLLCTSINDDIIDLWSRQLKYDLMSEIPSLAAKWIPSEGTSDDKTYNVTSKLSRKMRISKKDLRKKFLTPLRKKLNIIETHLTNKEYDKIDYTKIPRRSRCKYHNVLIKNDNDRYIKYLSNCSWFWSPNSYWDFDQLFSPERVYNENKYGKILIIIDNSLMMDKISKEISNTLIKRLINKHEIYLSTLNENLNIIKPKNSKELETYLDNNNSTMSCDQKLTEVSKEYDRILIITNSSNYVSINNSKTIWWAINHKPPEIKLLDEILYVNGYSKLLFKLFENNLIDFSYEYYINKILSAI